MRPALAGSVEELFHDVGQKEFMLTFATVSRATEVLRAARLERAIGVIYRPQTERASHYFRARLADQFDAVIHIDETRVLKPLERTARWDAGDLSARGVNSWHRSCRQPERHSPPIVKPQRFEQWMAGVVSRCCGRGGRERTFPIPAH